MRRACRQFKRAGKGLRTLKIQFGRVIRDVERKIKCNEARAKLCSRGYGASRAASTSRTGAKAAPKSIRFMPLNPRPQGL